MSQTLYLFVYSPKYLLSFFWIINLIRFCFPIFSKYCQTLIGFICHVFSPDRLLFYLNNLLKFIVCFLLLVVLDIHCQILRKINVSLFRTSLLLLFPFGWVLLNIRKLRRQLYFVLIYLDERNRQKNWNFGAWYLPWFRIN